MLLLIEEEVGYLVGEEVKLASRSRIVCVSKEAIIVRKKGGVNSRRQRERPTFCFCRRTGLLGEKPRGGRAGPTQGTEKFGQSGGKNSGNL